jgi:hypothetical protein
MKLRVRTYTGYSIGCAVVWAVILAAGAARGSKDNQRSKDNRRSRLLVCYGWWIGWLSATIARAVYPPPKSRQPTDAAHRGTGLAAG